jgi:glycosyltransferase involved in cell wall biosynthesis
MVGGYEEFCAFLAEGLGELHDVTVVTETPSDAPLSGPFSVIRSPTRAQLRLLSRTADLILMNSVSLKWLPQFIRAPGKVVAIHHTTYDGVEGLRASSLQKVKRLSTFGISLNICVSRYVASRVYGRRIVILNPFDDRLFFTPDPGEPSCRIAFVGRLVREKGCDLLLRAFASIRAAYPQWCLSIFGDGPERPWLVELSNELSLSSSVSFHGTVGRGELSRALRQHRVIVVPSRYEPFGIVALEGLASGCTLVHANTGGLPEAAGGFGIPFESNSSESLAAALAAALDLRTESPYVTASPNLQRYLSSRSRNAVLSCYLEALALSPSTSQP